MFKLTLDTESEEVSLHYALFQKYTLGKATEELNQTHIMHEHINIYNKQKLQ